MEIRLCVEGSEETTKTHRISANTETIPTKHVNILEIPLKYKVWCFNNHL